MEISIKSWTVTLLRISLAIVFIWFGLLKVLDLSPVLYMVTEVYDFLPFPLTFTLIGALEVLIGSLLLLNLFVRGAVILLWCQMFGVFLSLVLEPTMFFTNNNPLLITLDGEFVVKNIVLIAASIVVFSATRKKIAPTIRAI